VGYVVVAAAVMVDLLIVSRASREPGLAIVASGVPIFLLSGAATIPPRAN